MKKLILILLLGVTFVACQERGKITSQPQDFIEIHGKIYKLMRVVPCEDCHSIWIMYPKDSLDAQPTVINYEVPSGKTTVSQTVIKVD